MANNRKKQRALNADKTPVGMIGSPTPGQSKGGGIKLKKRPTPSVPPVPTAKASTFSLMPKITNTNVTALGMAMPHSAVELRFADNYCSTPTVTAKPYSINEVDFTMDCPVATPPLPSGNWCCFLSRNPLTATIQYVTTLPATITYPYYMTGGYGLLGANVKGIYRHTYGNGVAHPLVHYKATVIERVSGGTSSLHGGVVYPGHHAGRTAFFVTASAITKVYVQCANVTTYGNATLTPASNAAAFNLYQLVGITWVKVAHSSGYQWTNPRIYSTPGQTYSTTCTTYQLEETGWYSVDLDFQNVLDNIYDLEILWGSASDTPSPQFSISPMPGLIEHESTTRGIRVNGVSGMLSPYNAKMYRGGRCTGRQLESGMPWWLAALTCDELANNLGATEMSFDKGIYGFLKPDNDNCFALQVPNNFPSRPSYQYATPPQNLEASSYHNPIFPPGGWLQLAAEAPAGELAGSPYPTGKAHFTACYSVEYVTADTWFGASPPTITADDFTKAVAVMRNMQQFYENPNHARDILSFLKRTAGATWRIAPTLLQAVSAVSPELREIAQLLATVHKAASSTGWLPSERGW